MRRTLLAAWAAVLVTLAPAASHAQSGNVSPPTPRRLLVHITCGPDDPTRAALGFAVAKAALDGGHPVAIFLAGDGVQLIRDGVLANLSGLGTGNLRELYDGIVKGGGRFYV